MSSPTNKDNNNKASDTTASTKSSVSSSVPPATTLLQSKSSTYSKKFRSAHFITHHVSKKSSSSGSLHSGSHSNQNHHNDDDNSYFESKYETLQFLGKGRHSQIFSCRQKATGQQFAVKIWRKSRRNPRRTSALMPVSLTTDFEDINLNDSHDSAGTTKKETSITWTKGNKRDLHEFYILSQLSYPNIVSIYELLEEPTHYYMILDWGGGGTLQQALRKQDGERYPEDTAALILLFLTRAIAYLHSSSEPNNTSDQDDDSDEGNNGENSAHGTTKTVIHGDLNLSNVVLGSNQEKWSQLKLIDFGDALIDSLEVESDDDFYEPRGAQLPFVAPEVLSFDQPIQAASDMWSLGVMAYILLSGKYPFGGSLHGNNSNLRSKELERNIGQKLGGPTSHLFDQVLTWNDVSEEGKDFVQSLLQIDPTDRPTADEALQHPWLVKTRNRAWEDKLAGGGQHHHQHWQVHAKQVWNELGNKAKQRRASNPLVLKQAALTFIASQLLLKEEKGYIDEVFALMDVEADGFLTKDEVRKGYQLIFDKPLKERDLEALFARVDGTNTGTIEYSEFVIAAMNEKHLLKTDKLHKAFHAFDTDNSGYLSAANLRPLLHSYLQEHPVEEHVAILEGIIAQVDREGDGQISLDEFVAMMLHSSNKPSQYQRRRAPMLANDNDNTKRSPRGRSTTGVASSIRSAPSGDRSSMDSSLTTSMLLTEPPEVFASLTSSVTGERRKTLWQSSINLTFSPEHIIGRRAEELSQHYEIGDYIQSGGFGSVWFCTHKESGAERAVKYVKKSKHSKENELILREFDILRSLDHPNILKMYELFEDNEHFIIVMDVCKGGDLCDEIDNYGAIAEAGACLIIHQVLISLNYIHKKHIVHCDLKPENILLEENKAINQIKIIDFGLAANLVGETELQEGSVVDGRIKERRGTLNFMSPEVLSANYGPKADIWATGVMAFLLLSDRFPFDGKERSVIKEKIRRADYSFHSKAWGNITSKAKSFIKDCLTVDEDKRPSAEEALQHPWMTYAREAVAKNFLRKEVCAAAESLQNLKEFQAESVLAQATYTFIASQLLLKEEKARIDEIFRVLDTSCDGKLSKQEVKTGYKNVFGVEMSDQEVDQIFDRVDIDKTGFLEYNEFVIASISQGNLIKSDNLRKAFNTFDTENKGFITKSNLQRTLSTFLSADEQVDDKLIRKIMSEVDVTGDGNITYQEFVACVLNSADIPITSEPAKKAGLLEGFMHLFDKNNQKRQEKQPSNATC